MARRRKKKGKSRRTKTFAIGKDGGGLLGAVRAGDRLINHTGDGFNAKAAGAVGLGTGFIFNENWEYQGWDGNTASYYWKPQLAGVLVSTVLPKIPIVRTIPKKIPVIGKYLRW